MIKKIKGIVIKGNQIGRTIGFHTANIEYKKNDIIDGVYKINIIIEKKIYHGAGSFRKNLNLFESHIFNFNNDIYGKKIEIILLEKIRENKKIDSLEELKLLIENDIKKIKKIKYNVLTFGSFDYVHEGHKYFLNKAKKYSDKLITIIATDKNIEKFKGKKPHFKLIERIKHIKELNISDEVIGGNETNPLIWIDIYNPKIICLGYDQIGFSDNLKKYIKYKNLDTKIIRINPYKEKKYKSSIIKKELIL
ncbi:MAG: riboflavin kinase [Candidatus Gracilibacteria bacterium]|nr:riboflavin kinase [Candidatus Gracilibacteria bacterium]